MAKTTSRYAAIFTIIEHEFPTVLLEEVEFLRDKLKSGSSFDEAVQTLAAVSEDMLGDKTALAAACNRLREIEELSDQSLQTLARKIERENSDKESAKGNERRRIEEQELLNDSTTAADFGHYLPLAYWTSHEAVCLLLSKDPRRIQSQVVRGLPSFEKLHDILTRAVEINEIGTEDHIKPSTLVPWAIHRGIAVPETLATEFGSGAQGPSQQPDQRESNLVSGRDTDYGGMSIAELRNKLLECKSELKTARSANTKWKNTTLILLYGLLHGNFKGSPREKPASVQEVLDFVQEAIGRTLDQNTVRSRVDEINQLLAELQPEINHVSKSLKLHKK